MAQRAFDRKYCRRERKSKQATRHQRTRERWANAPGKHPGSLRLELSLLSLWVNKLPFLAIVNSKLKLIPATEFVF